jgi:predicted nucleotidyltransferase
MSGTFTPLTPDLNLARQFLDTHGPPDEVLQVGITGAHIYGFASPDSDIDMKGIHIVPTEQLLTLKPEARPFDRLEVYQGTECDLTTNEVAQALAMLLQGNGNVLERILSPLQLVDNEDFRQLAQLAVASVHRGFHKHYLGYFRGMQREHLLRGRAKTALYTYRVALTGTHLLATGELVIDVRPLASEAGFGNVAELVAFKASASEKETIPPELDRKVREDWKRLQEKLDLAHAECTLPEEAPNHQVVEQWLLKLRLDRLR